MFVHPGPVLHIDQHSLFTIDSMMIILRQLSQQQRLKIRQFFDDDVMIIRGNQAPGVVWKQFNCDD